jgi:hypothetical protein
MLTSIEITGYGEEKKQVRALWRSRSQSWRAIWYRVVGLNDQNDVPTEIPQKRVNKPA